MSRNNGASWTPVNTGWTARVASIAFAGGTMMIGTDNGVVLRPLTEMVGPAYATALAPQLINVSARAQVSPGAATLILGFVVTGNAPKQLLVRGVGPGLAPFGVTGVMSDPRIDIYRSTGGREVVISSNDNWNDAPNDSTAIAAASASVGAFPLAAAAKDAALIGSFSPGAYTVQLSGIANASGIALVEVYETP